MARKLRMLGIAWLATLGVSSMAVPGAQAVEFHSSAEHTFIQGSQATTDIFHAGAGFTATVCETTHLAGAITGKTTPSLPLTSSRGGCEDYLEDHVDVQCEGTPTKTLTASGSFHTSCGGTFREQYTRKNGTCTYTYKNQELKGVKYKNLGGKKGIEITFEAANWHIDTSGGFFNCFVTDGTKTGYNYTGTMILTGKDMTGEAVELWVE